MASTYSDLKIELIGTGDQSGTWGTTTNNNLGNNALGEAITGSADVTFASANVTVTLTDTNASQAARNLRLNLIGTTGGARDLILGSGCQIKKLYLINNTCADAITVKNTSGTGIAVAAGKSMFVYNNGTNVVDAMTHATSLTLGSALPVASGGTGTSTAFTTGSVVFAGASGIYTQDNANFFWDDTNNRLGIGTASPGRKLEVSGASAAGAAIEVGNINTQSTTLAVINTTGTTYSFSGVGGSTSWYYGSKTVALGTDSANPIQFIANGSERMRLHASGGVSIGNTSDPGATNLSVTGTITTGGNTVLSTAGGQNIAAKNVQQGSQNVGTMLTASGSLGGLELLSSSSSNAPFMAFHRPGAYASYFGLDTDNNFAVGGWSAGAALGLFKAGSIGIGTAASGTAGQLVVTNNIKSQWAAPSGSFPIVIGVTGAIPVDRGIAVTNSASAAIPFIAFTSTTTQAGYILTSGSTIAFVQGSDYRLKENVIDMDKSVILSKLMTARPVHFDWKDGNTLHNYGFIAHELQEVFPQAIHGEKDAVREDGFINPQSVNLTALVPYLVASIQEQQTIINNLKARITTLENK